MVLGFVRETRPLIANGLTLVIISFPHVVDHGLDYKSDVVIINLNYQDRFATMLPSLHVMGGRRASPHTSHGKG